jgi:hypothetical protein
MDLKEAIRERHAVRSYTDQPLPRSIADQLEKEIAKCNEEGGLHLQLVVDEPDAFSGLIAHYGHFEGVRNYICCIGKKGPALEERIGYYGERIALFAKTLELDSCWVALTYSKKKIGCKLARGEKLLCVITLGYGTTHGTQHKMKDPSTRYEILDGGPTPQWFADGLEAAMLAPTAVNQQRFVLKLSVGGIVRAEATGGSNSKIDLGIVKYHFEIGAGTENFTWSASRRS